MKPLITILTIFFSLNSFSQDSITVKITRVGTTEDKTVYWLKDIDSKEKYVTICNCQSKRKKGELVRIAKKDLVIIKDLFTKKDF